MVRRKKNIDDEIIYDYIDGILQRSAATMQQMVDEKKAYMERRYAQLRYLRYLQNLLVTAIRILDYGKRKEVTGKNSYKVTVMCRFRNALRTWWYGWRGKVGT